MPEFILDHGTPESARAFHALDSFTQGYIEAMFFTDCEEGSYHDDGDSHFGRRWNPETDSSLPGDVSVADLAPETLARIVADCQQFQTANAGALDSAYAMDSDAYDAVSAGRDFWYTRNGHGVGFWDRGLHQIGDELSEACRKWHNVDSCLGDDGMIYLV